MCELCHVKAQLVMCRARAAARELAVEGFIEVLSKGIVVDPLQPFRGPIRLRLVVSVPEE